MSEISERFTADTASLAATRRKLMVWDAFAFLSLTLVLLVLLAVTLLLFRSFTSHRAELGRRWSSRGQAALTQGKPEQAIGALRTALEYAPGDRSYELLLAQSLAEAGHTEEAWNYFESLWETEPGNGWINLQLARLALRRRRPDDAVNLYRAAIYGTWEGDGSVRRRAVRLELTEVLLQQGHKEAARAELLVIAGNADNDPTLELTLAALMARTGDGTETLRLYNRAMQLAPHDATIAAAAGRWAFDAGYYATAAKALQQASETAGRSHDPAANAVMALEANAERMLALYPDEKLPPPQRAERLLQLRSIGHARLTACLATQTGAETPTDLTLLNATWTTMQRQTVHTLQDNPAAQQAMLQLVFDTERITQRVCGAPAGDDALLLTMAQHRQTVEE
ncbi:MAG: tetratricopeptide repeat protein [Acidobacteriota bacterium]|nr:tetratricopeptide repeat protein [Acidobacteriota bacterium]